MTSIAPYVCTHRSRGAAARPRFAAFRRALSRRLRPCAAARGRAARRGHARRAALSRRAALRRDADRGDFPRAYIDANRSLADLDPAMLDGAVAGAARAVAQDRSRASGSSGASRAAARRCTTRKLTVDEVQRRIDRWYRPYHAALDGEIDDAASTRSAPSGTSTAIRCPPSATRTPTIRAASAPTSCSAIATARPARRSSRARRGRAARLGYSVAINDPYKGVELVRTHGRPAQRPAQPADRAQSAPLHGRGRRSSPTRTTRSSKPTSSGWSMRCAATCGATLATRLPIGTDHLTAIA